LDRQSTAGIENAFRFKIYVTKKGDHQSLYPNIGPADARQQTAKPKKTRRRKGKKSQIDQRGNAGGEDIPDEDNRDGENLMAAENVTAGENYSDGNTVQPITAASEGPDDYGAVMEGLGDRAGPETEGSQEPAGISQQVKPQPQKKRQRVTKKKQIQMAGLVSEGSNIDVRVTRQTERLRQDENAKNLAGKKQNLRRSGRRG
jgi:hypothetical protein